MPMLCFQFNDDLDYTVFSTKSQIYLKKFETFSLSFEHFQTLLQHYCTQCTRIEAKIDFWTNFRAFAIFRTFDIVRPKGFF